MTTKAASRRLARSQLASPLCEARLRFHPRLGFEDTKFVSLFVDSTGSCNTLLPDFRRLFSGY